MNRFELWDKVAKNSQCLLPQHFRLLVAVCAPPPPLATSWYNYIHVQSTDKLGQRDLITRNGQPQSESSSHHSDISNTDKTVLRFITYRCKTAPTGSY